MKEQDLHNVLNEAMQSGACGVVMIFPMEHGWVYVAAGNKTRIRGTMRRFIKMFQNEYMQINKLKK